MGIIIFLGFILFLRDKQKKYYKPNKYHKSPHSCPQPEPYVFPSAEYNPATGLLMMGSGVDMKGNFSWMNNHG